MRMFSRVMITAAAAVIVACGDRNPAAPTPPSTATVTAVTVTSGSTSGPTFQLTATARMSDSTTQDVTGAAAWESSNTALATVSAGMVTVLGTGEVDVRAIYKSVSGSMHLLVARIPVTTVSISGATSEPAFQLKATARLSDGSTQDVTASATWESLNTQVATVSPTGYVRAVGDGEVDIRATYQGVTGLLRLVMKRPATFTLSGTVREIAPNVRPLGGVVVRIFGESTRPTTTNDSGAFTFTGVPAGRVLVEFAKEGYQILETDAMLDRDVELTTSLYPTPPKDANGVTATARCNDSSWSWAQTSASACTANQGVAYFVCPGPLCQSR